MHQKVKVHSLAVAVGTVFAVNLMTVSSSADAAENPFRSNSLAGGYLVAEQHEAEGKCGEGKCAVKTIKTMDADSDGSISKDEFMKKHEQMFANMDENGNGAVSAEEMKAAHEGKCGEGKCGVEK
ncbi:MAG: HvfA family oxazolone/thioamide-modified RiPP metallophore [Chromatiales bacterium]